jgi:trehalose 6-phosphate phosphatase
MLLRGTSIHERDIALFLDVDGTLLEIAETPDAVKVPAALRNTLYLAASREDGALALISGRCVGELDRLFAPYVFPASGQHGLERRDAQGRYMRPKIDTLLLRPVREALVEFQMQHSGLLIEDKGTALALHYRLTPKLEPLVIAMMEELASPLTGRFSLRMGKCVVELTPSGYSKRAAVEAFMSEVPFVGRVPVFIGDDVSDEEGFEAVNALGGYSVRVGLPGKTQARYSFSNVSTVIAWLRQRNLNPPQAAGRR